jgi:HTH-type transcriptional regulator, competence development regulator
MNEDHKKLGEFLVAARKKMGLSLRSVEEATEISNAYLSQLEHARIKSPAPAILHKLAKHYSVPYSLLMELAGHPVADLAEGISESSARIAARFSDVTEEEEEELAGYLEFIRSRRKSLR